jgi:hypothetical protein
VLAIIERITRRDATLNRTRAHFSGERRVAFDILTQTTV